MEQTNERNSTEEYVHRTVENTSIEKLNQVYNDQIVIATCKKHFMFWKCICQWLLKNHSKRQMGGQYDASVTRCFNKCLMNGEVPEYILCYCHTFDASHQLKSKENWL